MRTSKKSIYNLAIQQILKLIWDYGPVSRVDLGKISGYSKSTITKNCDAMIAQGIIKEDSILKDGIVSKRTNLVINQDYAIVTGVELGAASCCVGISDFSGKLISKERFAIDYNSGPETILDTIISSIKNQIIPYSDKTFLGIGMGVPSPVDFERGVAVHPSFMPGWHNYPVKKYLQDTMGCDVYVDNEVHSMALGENYISEDLKSSNLLFIKAGFGIGSGILIDGNIYRGSTGMGGNIGHITIDNNTNLCKCGKRGCLESVVGGDALLSLAEKELGRGVQSKLSERLESNGKLIVKDIYNAFKNGDSLSSQIIQDAGKTLGRTVGKMVVFLDPDSVIIGGDLSDFGSPLISSVYQGILEESSQWLSRDFIVRKSLNSKDVGMIGSAILCIDQLIQHKILS
jgi:predicted NBD/HSP70 family sugar kinase